jgi:membrane-associated protein
MEHVFEFLKNLHSSEGIIGLIRTGGLALIAFIIFAETGLLVGFFLPGDSLIITAGIFTAANEMTDAPLFSLNQMLLWLSIAAIIGDQCGYFLGTRAGEWVRHRPDSWLIKKKHLKKAHDFYEKYGSLAIILAHFMPILRTFVPFAAGASKMTYSKFARVNVIGAVLWVWSMTLIGHYIGTTPLAKKLDRIIVLVVFVSILPMIISFVRKVYFSNRKGRTH